MEEIWKDIIGYEGLYEISNLGNVMAKEKTVPNVNGTRIMERTLPKRLLKPQSDRYGYFKVNLYRHSKMTAKTIHRLVGVAFIPNPENKPCINHIDYNKGNNFIENLEWCDHEYNYNHSKDRIKKSMKSGENHHTTTLTNEQVIEIKKLKGIKRNFEIAIMFGVSQPLICDIMKGKKWKYV